MANIVFPSSPTVDQIYTDSTTNKSWKWNGNGWDYLGKNMATDVLTEADVIDALGYTPANELIEFKATEIDDDYTILADDVGKECVINSATDVNITVGTAIPVGGRVWFRIVGAGLPVPVGTVTQDITVPDLTDRTFVELYRQPDDIISGNEKYEVI